MQKNPKYPSPYIPKGREILYVPLSNLYMTQARDYARVNSLDKEMPNTSIIVKAGKVIGIGANGSNYHEQHGCERVRQNIPTGEGYELCEGCHPKNHGESRAINDAIEKGNDPKEADLYMWGHWWCCKNCWEKIISSGIKNVYLLENSEVLFNKKDPENIIGHQLD
ncbi:MAG: deaminase [Candidatus Paceibacterota bacterium]